MRRRSAVQSGKNIIPFAVVTIGLLIGVALAISPLLSATILAAVLMMVMAVRWPLALVFVTALAAMVIGLPIQLGLVPATAQAVVDFGLMLSALSALAHGVRRRTGRLPMLMPGIGVFVLVMLVSAAVNRIEALQLIMSLRSYLRFALLYFAVLMIGGDERTPDRIVKILAFAAFAQIPVVLAQYFAFGSVDWDMVSGTLGTGMSGVLAAWTVLIAGLLLRLRSADASSVPRGAGVAALLLFLPTVLGEAKGVFVVIVAVAIWLFMSSLRAGAIKRAFVMALSVLAIALVGLSVYQSIWGVDLKNVAYLREYSTMTYASGEAGRLRRIPLAQYAVWRVSREPIAVLIGFGPGAASERSVLGIVGRLFEENPLAYVGDILFSRMTLELGLAGWCALLWIVLLTRRIAGYARRTGDGVRMALADSLWFIGLAQIPLSIYTSAWTADALAITFWLLAAAAEASAVGRPAAKAEDSRCSGRVIPDV